MGQYKEWVHKLPEEIETMQALTDMTDEFVETVKITHPQKYSMFMEKVANLFLSNHFNEETLNETVKQVPRHYDVATTTKYTTENFDIDFSKEHFNEYDLNFIMNEMYKLYNNIYDEDTTKYAELTISWLDHHGNCALKYYKAMYK